VVGRGVEIGIWVWKGDSVGWVVGEEEMLGDSVLVGCGDWVGSLDVCGVFVGVGIEVGGCVGDGDGVGVGLGVGVGEGMPAPFINAA